MSTESGDLGRLQTVPGEEYWPMVEAVWDDLIIFEDPDLFVERFQRTPVANRNLFAAHWCQSEVNNGGFKQFFWNSTGVLGPEAETGFREIGMPGTAAVVGRAVQLFSAPYPRDRSQRWEQLERIDRSLLDSLDHGFYELINSEAGGFEASADAYARRSHSNGARS